MKTILRNQKGITLIEMLIVLAVMGVLAAAIVPNVGGFINRGKTESFDGDQRALQTAVDAYKSDTSKRATSNVYPVLDTANCTGAPTDTCDSYIDIGTLASEGYISGDNIVSSADTSKNTSATNSPSGSYGWYIDTTGTVKANPAFDGETYP